MSSSARIKLVGDNIDRINEFVNEIKDVVEKLGVGIRGPIPMPTKKLKITTRKSPDGEGKASFERFQMRIHKRVIDLEINERVLRKIMKIQIPKGVNIEIKLI
ncbi:MAG: 30S ribosomal protein S10 [Candidatus Woesearchaeota archaeon]|jgi:small subunit ribosomal protein S10|nr:30S ribosomal protein S10 [Candidatus Woesearchaeota archaeon]